MTARTADAPRSPFGRLRDFRARVGDASHRHRSTSVIVGMLIVTVLMIFLPKYPPFTFILREQSWFDAFANAGTFVLLAMGLNVVVGLAGLLDLGYAAFFAIGAYAYAYSNSPYSGVNLPFLPMLVVGAAVAAVFGIALGAPTLRLRGDYLAIMTLGFGEIVPIVFLNLENWTQGTNGIGGIYRPEPLPFIGPFGALTPFAYFILMAGIVTIAMVLLYRLQDSRVGRAWNAIREDELAAAANGINTVTTKLLAFALGATTAGLAGVFNASKLTIVSPDQFYFTVSFTVLAMVILGGMGNIWGVAAGAFVVFMIQTVALKQLNTIKDALHLPALDLGPVHFDLAKIDFTSYQFLLYGVALVLMMLLRPEGLFPSQRRRRELHIADEMLADHLIDEAPIVVDEAAVEAALEGALGETPGADEELGDSARKDVP
jgi:ABC-type branched-subunit amino acid transport system permease subunit